VLSEAWYCGCRLVLLPRFHTFLSSCSLSWSPIPWLPWRHPSIFTSIYFSSFILVLTYISSCLHLLRWHAVV
jgi:hypothetical protein